MAIKYIQDPNNPNASIPDTGMVSYTNIPQKPPYTKNQQTVNTPKTNTSTTNIQITPEWSKQVIESTPNAQSYLSGLLTEASKRGLNVENILNTPNYIPPKAPESIDTGNAQTTTDLIAAQLKNIQQEKADYENKMSGKSNMTDLISAYSPPKIDITGQTAQQEQKYGISDKLAKMEEQNAIVAGLNGELNQLNIEELTAIDRAEGRSASRGAIEGEKETITRDYNIKKAYKSAELYSQAALAQVYSDNYANAQNLVNKAVDNYLVEIKQEIDDYNNLFSLQSDWIQSLDEKEQKLLEQKYNDLVKKEEQTKEDKQNVLNLMLENPNAGITIEDTLESAAQKVATYNKVHPEISQTIGSSETGYTMYDKYGNVIGTKTGSEGGIKLSDSQIMAGATKAKMTIEQFKNLPIDEKAWYITGRYDDTLNNLAEIALSEGLDNASYAITNDTTIPQPIKQNLLKDIIYTTNSLLESQTQIIKSTPDKISLYDTNSGKEEDITFGLKDIDNVAKNLGYGSGYWFTGNNVDALYDAIDEYVNKERAKKRLDSEIFKDVRFYLKQADDRSVTADNPLIKY